MQVDGWTVGRLPRSQPASREPPPVSQAMLRGDDVLAREAEASRPRPAVSVNAARAKRAAARLNKHKVRDHRILKKRAVAPTTQRRYEKLLAEFARFLILVSG